MTATAMATAAPTNPPAKGKGPKALDPNAIPFFSPATLRKQVKAGKPLDPKAAEFVDPSVELESENVAAMMEEFIIETELAEAVVEVGKEAQDEADTAITEAQDAGLLSPRPVTDAEVEAEGAEFVAVNALVEGEAALDPEADPAEGMDEATAAMASYGGALLKSPTASEIGEAGELFRLENEIDELEGAIIEEAVEGDEASTALEQMDAALHLQELHAEEKLAAAVIALGAEEQAEADSRLAAAGAAVGPLSPTESEIDAEAAAFQLENAITEAEQALDPEADPAEGLDEAAAMLAADDAEREVSLEAHAFEVETTEAALEADGAAP